MFSRQKSFALIFALALLSVPLFAQKAERGRGRRLVRVEVFAHEKNYRGGLGGRGWFVDLGIGFEVP